MNKSMDVKRQEVQEQTAGDEGQMQVEFREVDPFNLWVSSLDGCYLLCFKLILHCPFQAMDLCKRATKNAPKHCLKFILVPKLMLAHGHELCMSWCSIMRTLHPQAQGQQELSAAWIVDNTQLT